MTTNTTTAARKPLAAGWAEVRLPTAAGTYAAADEHVLAMVAACRRFLAYWARLAYGGAPADMPAPPAGRSGDAIVEWAGRLLDAAYEAEGDMAPDASRRVAYDDGWQHPTAAPRVNRVKLGWAGTWTPGRWVAVEFILDSAGVVDAARLTWCSGTGETSRYLDIEELLQQLDDAGVVLSTAFNADEASLLDEMFHENI